MCHDSVMGAILLLLSKILLQELGHLSASLMQTHFCLQYELV